ncbi:MAG: quercetin dioxygenase-like cupin family protein [Polaribacter sp.]|jgi:quercetin dioxygenase-like cupin family protein|tara:strand:- start:3892 stop:4212 length:321 start_codon:yes stop_codon:yes gene_type:complete
MEIKQITYPSPEEDYNKPFFTIKNEKLEIQFGTVFLKKGTRIPEKGFTRHDSHEISIIQKGKIEMLNEDGSVKGYLKTGDVVSINALEAQAGNVLEDTQLMYTLIK